MAGTFKVTFPINYPMRKLLYFVSLLTGAVPKDSIDTVSALVQIMAWRQIGDNIIILTQLPSDAYMRR